MGEFGMKTMVVKIILFEQPLLDSYHRRQIFGYCIVFAILQLKSIVFEDFCESKLSLIPFSMLLGVTDSPQSQIGNVLTNRHAQALRLIEESSVQMIVRAEHQGVHPLVEDV